MKTRVLKRQKLLTMIIPLIIFTFLTLYSAHVSMSELINAVSQHLTAANPAGSLYKL